MMNNTLKINELKTALQTQGIEIAEVESHRNGVETITYIGFNNMFIRYICIVENEEYNLQDEEYCVNVYCGSYGDTKYGAWIKTYDELAEELVKINNYNNVK